jgi:hypothetical protein
MKKANDTGTSKPGHRKRRMGYFVPVMEWDGECRNADVGISFHDADA